MTWSPALPPSGVLFLMFTTNQSVVGRGAKPGVVVINDRCVVAPEQAADARIGPFLGFAQKLDQTAEDIEF